jgi:extracellular factor (EF) 3-hydroxypalmitic acid methyl ester biosynthesis protein
VVMGPDDSRFCGQPPDRIMDQPALLEEVRAAANGLLADLERARRQSNDWQDDELGYALVANALSRCLVRLSATGCQGRDNERPSNELWRIAGSLLEVGSLQHRARFKPLEYAGDHIILSQFCDHYVCDHPLGRLLDRYFQSQAAVEAVRSRTEQLGEALAEFVLNSPRPRVQVCSIGVGPAYDIERGLRLLPEARRQAIHVTLLDLHEATLNFAADRLRRLLPPEQVTCRRDNPRRLAEKREPAIAPASCDFLICSGLFDYLPAEPAAKLLAWMWSRLTTGGRLLIGNFAPHNPSRPYMEWFGNWYLLYRTSAEMHALGMAAGIPESAFHIGAERLGIDLFLCADRPAS